MAYSKTDFTQDSGTQYKAKIDDNFAALEQAANTDFGSAAQREANQNLRTTDDVEFNSVDAGEIKENGNRVGPLTSNTTFSIPTDYSTLQDAINDLGHRSVKQGVTITLNIEAGHALTHGLDVRNGDFRHFRITSADATVLLASGFTPASAPAGESFSETNSPVLLAINAVAPRWEILVDADDLDGDLAGYHLIRSGGIIASGCGVKNTGQMGLIVSDRSSISANGSVFSGAGRGNRVTGSSDAALAGGIDFSGSLVDAASRAALDVSRGSTVTLAANDTQTPANLSNAAGDGINVRRSSIAATNANVSGAGATGLNAQLGALVEAASINADNCGDRPVRVVDGSMVSVDGGTLTNAGQQAIFVGRGSKVNATGADVTGFTATDAVQVFGGSIVSATGMTGSPTFNVSTNSITSNGIIFN